MAHKRQDIRSALVTMLAGQTGAGANVFNNRITPLSHSQLPAIVIHSREETGTARDTGATKYIRQLNVEVTIAASGAACLDTVDNIAAQVESIITDNKSLNGQVLGTVYQSMNTTIEDDGQALIASLTLTFDCKYIL